MDAIDAIDILGDLEINRDRDQGSLRTDLKERAQRVPGKATSERHDLFARCALLARRMSFKTRSEGALGLGDFVLICVPFSSR